MACIDNVIDTTATTNHQQATNLKFFKAAGVALLILVVSFVTLVPGGPIETRDFSALGGSLFWGFNVFLIALCALAFVCAIGLLRNQAWPRYPAIAAAWGYIFVVLLDLGQVFPTSPDAIPLLLGIVEIFDAILAGYVIALTHRGMNHI